VVEGFSLIRAEVGGVRGAGRQRIDFIATSQCFPYSVSGVFPSWI